MEPDPRHDDAKEKKENEASQTQINSERQPSSEPEGSDTITPQQTESSSIVSPPPQPLPVSEDIPRTSEASTQYEASADATIDSTNLKRPDSIISLHVSEIATSDEESQVEVNDVASPRKTETAGSGAVEKSSGTTISDQLVKSNDVKKASSQVDLDKGLVEKNQVPASSKDAQAKKESSMVPQENVKKNASSTVVAGVKSRGTAISDEPIQSKDSTSAKKASHVDPGKGSVNKKQDVQSGKKEGSIAPPRESVTKSASSTVVAGAVKKSQSTAKSDDQPVKSKNAALAKKASNVDPSKVPVDEKQVTASTENPQSKNIDSSTDPRTVVSKKSKQSRAGQEKPPNAAKLAARKPSIADIPHKKHHARSIFQPRERRASLRHRSHSFHYRTCVVPDAAPSENSVDDASSENVDNAEENVTANSQQTRSSAVGQANRSSRRSTKKNSQSTGEESTVDENDTANNQQARTSTVPQASKRSRRSTKRSSRSAEDDNSIEEGVMTNNQQIRTNAIGQVSKRSRRSTKRNSLVSDSEEFSTEHEGKRSSQYRESVHTSTERRTSTDEHGRKRMSSYRESVKTTRETRASIGHPRKSQVNDAEDTENDNADDDNLDENDNPEEIDPNTAKKEDKDDPKTKDSESTIDFEKGFDCPRCVEFVKPFIDTYPSKKTHFFACFICFIGTPLLICLPYLFDWGGVKIARCPNCGYIPKPKSKKVEPEVDAEGESAVPPEDEEGEDG